MNNLKYGLAIHFLSFTSENEVVLSKYGRVECDIWLFHAQNKCIRTGCEKVFVWDHCLGHKSCDHQTL